MIEKYSLADLMSEQLIFEHTRKGTDGSLWQKNTVEYGLRRGVIGEAEEALEELQNLHELHILTPDAEELIKATHDKLVLELVDVFIFLSSIFNHAGLTADQVMELTRGKVAKNFSKYEQSNFEGKTIAEGLQYSRDKAAGRLPNQLIEHRRRNGHPRPGNDPVSGEADELDYLASGVGSLS
jgi:hypothetical protein